MKRFIIYFPLIFIISQVKSLLPDKKRKILLDKLMRRSELKTEKLKENDSNYILNSLKKHGISYDINEIDQIIRENSFENN